jgi:SOS response regulatory protein OraA/RecX
VRVLRKTLENKGLGEGEVSKIINSLPEDYEKTRAVIDAKRKLNKLSNIPIYIKRSKITSYLYSKGYSPDTVRFVVDSILTLQ